SEISTLSLHDALPIFRDALTELGSLGGILDANDDLAAGPVALIVDPNLSLINRNNPTHTAGVTFFGQFLDHDMTFDLTSRQGTGDRKSTRLNSSHVAI